MKILKLFLKLITILALIGFPVIWFFLRLLMSSYSLSFTGTYSQIMGVLFKLTLESASPILFFSLIVLCPASLFVILFLVLNKRSKLNWLLISLTLSFTLVFSGEIYSFYSRYDSLKKDLIQTNLPGDDVRVYKIGHRADVSSPASSFSYETSVPIGTAYAYLSKNFYTTTSSLFEVGSKENLVCSPPQSDTDYSFSNGKTSSNSRTIASCSVEGLRGGRSEITLTSSKPGVTTVRKSPGI